MTQQQRWDEDFNNHLLAQKGAGKDQYNFAYDNYSKDLDDAVARGEITSQEAAQARQHTLTGIGTEQRAFVSNYLASYNNGDHTDADRKGIRGTKIWTTHGDNGLVHFRHGDFGENTTFGGAERGYAQRDARMAAGGGRGGAGARAGKRAGVNGGARGGAPQMPNNSAQAARPNDASRYDDMRYGPFGGAQTGQSGASSSTTAAAPVATDPASATAQRGNAMMRGGAPANASNVTPTAPPSPITFKGGYTVGGVNGDVDWAAKGDGSINVGGAKLTADQYNAFNNVRSSLATQLRQQEGLSHTEARARATQMANQWMADQTAVANGGKAQNRWQHVENPQPAAKPTAQPAAPSAAPAQPTAPETPAKPAAPATPPKAPGGTPVLDLGPTTTPATAQTGGPTSPQPVAQSGTPTAQTPAPAPSYEKGFAHTSRNDFINNHENASYEDVFKHYGGHTYRNMEHLKAKLTRLKNRGMPPEDPEYKRLAKQYDLSRNRHTSIIHAMDDMDQKGLNDIYPADGDAKFDWIFDQNNDSSAYWKENHAPGFGVTLQGRRDRMNAMPEEYATFNARF